MKIGLFFLLFAVLGCEKRPEPTSPGHRLTEAYECYRCHDGGAKWAPQTTENGCVSCHVEIQTGQQDDDYPKEHLDEWKRNIVSYPRVPSLEGASRFRPEWVAEFLQHPADLRPSLSGMMPRLKITKTDAVQIATFLASDAQPFEAIASGDAKTGEMLFREKACGSCHAMGRTQLTPKALPPGVVVSDMGNATRLAPDLSVTRERMTRAATVAWLADPRAFDKTTLMPKFPLKRSEREDLVAYIFEFQIPPLKPPIKFTRLPVLERDVFYPEVEREVFRDTCWHCHSTPRWFSDQDGGPGNIGGFGYPGKRIDLSNFHSVTKGGESDGKRIDLLENVDGTPRLVRHLIARHEELAGNPSKVLGMPLGLKPYSAEKIQIVETWIQQGARRGQ